jgi:hypothetical protein
MSIRQQFSFKSGFTRILGVLAFTFLCVQSMYAQTETFDFTGAVQTYTVPSGVTSVFIECWGAEGGNATLNANVCPGQAMGGDGGYSSGDLAVTPGQTLFVFVGGAGGSGNTGGFNGAGQVNGLASTCSKGGGASDVRQGGNTL